MDRLVVTAGPSGALCARQRGSPSGRPTIVCLQAGDLHSGDFDPFGEAVALAHARGAWVHVDGAFGLWAAASSRLRHFVTGIEGADFWATDAHKTLNVPYDCGVVIVRDPAAMRAAMGMHGDYLLADEQYGDPHERVPELSRRGRAFPVWALLRSLGRSGVAVLVDGLVFHARATADGLRAIDGAELLNEVVFTQVCAAFGSDERTRAVVKALMADGTTWMTGSRWRGRDVLRISVSNWSTDEVDVKASLAALRRRLRRVARDRRRLRARDLDEIAAGVVEDCRRDPGDLEWLLGEFDSERLEAFVLGVHVVDGE
jgi:glutamate/tyrosine decarboxylase-like PLP-dependent enzyme